MGNEAITNQPVIIIDIETTGLNPSYAEIVEIGAVKVNDGKIVARFQALIWPGEEAFKLPGVHQALTIQKRKVGDFRGGLTEEDAKGLLLHFVGDDPVISYNSGFERKFLDGILSREQDWKSCIMIDSSWTMGEAGSEFCPWNDYHNNYKWPKLIHAAEYFGIHYDPDISHSALYDAEIAAEIWLKMQEASLS